MAVRSGARRRGARVATLAALCCAGAACAGPRDDVRLVLTGSYASGNENGAEILSVQPSSARVVVTNTRFGTVELLSLADPSAPRRLARFALGLAPGETLTSVAFHPSEDWFLAAVQAADPRAPGYLALHGATRGERLARLPAGVGPDSVAIDPSGRWALAACEGESYAPGPGGLVSPPGSVTLVRFAREPAACAALQIALPEHLAAPGALLREHARFVEREVGGVDRLVPLDADTPDQVEPECAAFSPDGRRGFVTLQEHNAVLVLDLERAAVERVFGLGLSEHAADLADDGRADFSAELLALREPDGIALTPDGRYFVTADEGDTLPKASRLEPGKPAGGGRTLSVFDARTGAFVGDTGAGLDRAAAAAGVYPDSRSDAKGSEPEMLCVFDFDGRLLAAVGLERADAVALVDLSDPRAPEVLGVAPVRAPGETSAQGPEGVAHYRDARTGRHYVLTANEVSGTLRVLRVEPGR